MGSDYQSIGKRTRAYSSASMLARVAPELRVLVVEDDAAVAEGLRLLLHRYYEVTVASGGREALEHLHSGVAHDVILCDLMMPGMSGMELYRRLRAESPGMELRVVFMTGGAFTPEAEEFLGGIQNSRLEKPFEFAVMHELLQRTVHRVGA